MGTERVRSSVELVEQALDRIEAVDGRVGAFVTVLADQAREEAARRDAEAAAGQARGAATASPSPSRTWSTWPGW